MRNKHWYKIAAMAVISTTFQAGCRSTGGWNPLARRSEPSAEMLAGAGPTTTYPKPPSSNATPQAIASIAGGTTAPAGSPGGPMSASAQVAGLGVSPGYATPSGHAAPSGYATNGVKPSATGSSAGNYAAASANGIYTSQPVGYKTPAAASTTNPSPPTSPGSNGAASAYASAGSGYQFGSKSAANPPAATAPAAATISDATAAKNPAANWMPPAFGSTGSAAPKPTASASTGSAFALPASNSATSKPTAPASSFTIPPFGGSAPAQSNDSNPTASAFAMPGMADVAAGVKNVASGAAKATGQAAASIADATQAVVPASASADAASTYLPGSTQSSGGYPGTRSTKPATTGTFYR